MQIQLKWIMHLVLKIIGWKCWCRNTTRIFDDTEGYYVRCLECGRRLAYDWDALGTFDPAIKCVDSRHENRKLNSWSDQQAV